VTKIEWTHRPNSTGKTWNMMRARNKKTGGVGHFCEKVSPGCKNCYAETFQKRFQNPVRYAAQDADQVEVFLDQKTLVQPIGWKKPATIFVCSQTDLFLHHYSNEWIDQVFAVMALCPQHTFIILTKRHDRMNAYFQKHFTRHKCGHIAAGITGKQHPGGHGCDPDVCNMQFPLPNVWIGVSVEDQKAADERIPVLLDTPAAVRFLSVEPLLGPVDLTRIAHENGDSDQYYNAVEGYEISCGQFQIDGLNWVIVGGESGHNARPMHPDWARSLRDQCKAAGVPFFFKQNGSWISAKPGDKFSDGLWVHQNGDTFSPVEGEPFNPAPLAEHMIRVGKKRAGRSLDGVEHNEWPEVKS